MRNSVSNSQMKILHQRPQLTLQQKYSMDLTCCYRLLYGAVMHSTIDVHICDKVMDINSSTGTSRKYCPFCLSDYLSISVLSLKKILAQALSWYYMYKSMQALSHKASISVDELPFLSIATSQMRDHNCATTSYVTEEVSSHYERVGEVLRSWNLMRVPISPDGNCLFHSVLYNACVQCEIENSELDQVLNANGISN